MEESQPANKEARTDSCLMATNLRSQYTLAYSVYPCILPPCAAESSGVMGKRKRRNTSKNPHSSDGRNGQRKDDATLKESN